MTDGPIEKMQSPSDGEYKLVVYAMEKKYCDRVIIVAVSSVRKSLYFSIPCTFNSIIKGTGRG